MNRLAYIRRASRRFLSGTPYRSPVEAVEHGVRSLEEWARILNEERERAQQQPQTAKRPASSNPQRHEVRGSSGLMKGRL
jgi:hypothetical protein